MDTLKELQKQAKKLKLSISKHVEIDLSSYLQYYDNKKQISITPSTAEFIQSIQKILIDNNATLENSYLEMHGEGEYSSYSENLVLCFNKDKTEEELIIEIQKKLVVEEKAKKAKLAKIAKLEKELEDLKNDNPRN